MRNTRPHVTEVTTSIKSGGNVKIGKYTLITGRNRSGKSTILNAIEAAGSGRVSDVAGRSTLAKDSELITLAPDDSREVSAKITFSDGTVSEWNLLKGHRAVRSGPEIAFPLREVKEAILGEPDKARKWILRHGGEVRWMDITNSIPKSLHRQLDQIIREDGGEEKSNPAAILALAIDAAKKRTREANGAVKLSREASKAGGAFGVPPSAEEITEAEKLASAPLPDTRGRDALISVRGEVAALEEKIAALVESVSVANANLNSLPATTAPTEVARAALLVAETLVRANVKQCAICGGNVDPKILAERVTRARAKLDESIKTAERRAEITSVLRVAEQQLVNARRELLRAQSEAGRLKLLVGEVDGAPAPIPPDREAARAHLSELLRRKAGWEAARRAEEEALTSERTAAEWSQLAEALSKALGVLVDQARTGFEAKVQKYLPAGWIFGVDLRDGEREILRIGLREENGTLRTALSGAEWATTTAALALATLPESGPAVIAPEERAFDPVTLESVMAALGDAPAQVILTSPTLPVRVPPGWTVIETGGMKTDIFA